MGAPKKPALYVLDHGVVVIHETPPGPRNNYTRVTIRPHWLFPEVKVNNGSCSVRRSRVVLAVKLGRPLQVWELAHHKDEDKTNDAPSNLEIETSESHNKHHKTGSKHTAESKAKIANSLKLAYAEGRRGRKELQHD